MGHEFHKLSKRIEGKLFGISLITILFFFNSFLSNETSNQQDVDILIRSLQEENVDLTEITFQVSGVIGHNDNERSVHTMKEKIEDVFNINMNGVAQENSTQLRFEGQSSLSSHTQLQVAWVGQEDQKKEGLPFYHTYFIAEISSNQLENWSKDYTFLSSKLDDIGIKLKINTVIMGFINRTMEKDEQEAFVRTLFTKLDGEVSEGLIDDSVVSLSGYSNKLNRSVTSASGEINLQINTYVNSQTKTTLITVGTPVIVTGH